MTINETIDALEHMLETIQIDDNYYIYYETINSALKHLRRSKRYRKEMKRFKRKFVTLKREEKLNETI